MPLEPFKIDADSLLRDRQQLPPLPGTLSRVLAVIQGDQAGSSLAVADVIGRDVAMVTHILKLVNSAYYGVLPAITSLRHAIAFLGLSEVAHIAMAVSVINALKPEDSEQVKSFWLHSYLTAIIAKMLSRRVKGVYDIDNLYSAALLHDIGKLVYQRLYPRHYRELVRYCQENGCFLTTAEAHFGVPSHGALGALLCDHWQLPKSVRRAAEFHELPHLHSISDPERADPLDVLITAANLLADLLTDPLAIRVREEVHLEVRRAFALSDDQFLILMGDVYGLRMKAEDVIESLLG